MAKGISWTACLLAAVLLFALDSATKQLALRYLHSEVPLFQNLFGGIDLSLTYATNTGAAWGCFSDAPFLLVGVRIVLIACLISYLIFYCQKCAYRLPLILIITGAIGNVIDFFLYGHVIDMIHFVFWEYDYPVFNVADMLIFFGTASLLWGSIRDK